MTCHEVQSQLNALVDGELGWLAAGRVRRHLAVCPACVAELSTVQQITVQVRAWRCVAAPAALMEKISMTVSARTILPRRTRLFWRPAVALGGCAATLAAIALLLPGQPAHPTIVFADVERAMAQVNTLHCTQTIKLYRYNPLHDPNPDTRRTLLGQESLHVWARRSSPAVMTRTTFDKPWKAESKHMTVILTDRRGQIIYDASRRTYYIRDGRKEPEAKEDAATVDKIIRGLTNPRDTRWPNMGQASMSPLQREQDYLDGKPVLKFVCTGTSATIQMRKATRKTFTVVLKKTVWVDPQTLHVLQMETTSTQRESGKLLDASLFHDYQYDALPPVGTFDWSPPPGAHVVKF